MVFRPPFIRPVQWGIAATLLAALTLLLIPQWLLERPRELFFDALTQWGPHPVSSDIVVIDIDRESQEALAGGWHRPQTTELVRRLVDTAPAVIAFDLALSGNCDPTLLENQSLASVLDDTPTVLGFLVGEDGGPPPQPKPPLAILHPFQPPANWLIDGAEGACPIFETRATSTAATFLLGDDDARTRRVEAYAILGNDAYPALAIEAVRLGLKVSTPILGGTPLRLRLGTLTVNLEENGEIRFIASDAGAIADRTISAGDILAGKVSPEQLTGKILFIGSSNPVAGGSLHKSASMPLEPSVQIHADFANGLMTNSNPLRPARIIPFEAIHVLLAGIAISLATPQMKPVATALFGIATIAATLFGAYLIYATTAVLTDGFSVALALVFVLLVASTAQFAEVRRTEALARRRFAQFLPQAVVDRYLDTPNLEKLAGEERLVTALTTDIESFSALTRTTSRRDLIDMLDAYLAEVTSAIHRHGGMVDKIVGDGVYALFNAPGDLEVHVTRAIECAQAIVRISEDLRHRHPFLDSAFGRTRIGIETGPVLLGQAGRSGKLDSAAYGDAINIAARLLEVNKLLGTSICIGPQAGRAAAMPLHRLGAHEIRGYGRLELFTPLPNGNGGRR